DPAAVTSRSGAPAQLSHLLFLAPGVARGSGTGWIWGNQDKQSPTSGDPQRPVGAVRGGSRTCLPPGAAPPTRSRLRPRSHTAVKPAVSRVRVLNIVGSLELAGTEQYIVRVAPLLRRYGVAVEICVLDRRGPLVV